MSIRKSTPTGSKILESWRNKGIKVAEAVYLTKGLKRFEKNKMKLKQKEEASLNKLSARKAYERLQTLRNKSSYADTYGKEAEADHDSSILTFKKLKDLACTEVLDSVVFGYFERWLLTANETYYKDLLMRLFKSIYVYAKNKEPSKSLHKSNFLWTNREEIQKPPRIDKLSIRKVELPGEEQRYIKFPELRKASLNQTLTGYKQKFDLIRQETKILSSDIKKRTIARNAFNNPEDVANVPIDLTLSKKMKGKFIQGSGDINALYEDQEPKATSYQQSFKGSNLKYENYKIDGSHYLSTLLTVSPDPYILNKTMKRTFTKFE